MARARERQRALICEGQGSLSAKRARAFRAAATFARRAGEGSGSSGGGEEAGARLAPGLKEALSRLFKLAEADKSSSSRSSRSVLQGSTGSRERGRRCASECAWRGGSRGGRALVEGSGARISREERTATPSESVLDIIDKQSRSGDAARGTGHETVAPLEKACVHRQVSCHSVSRSRPPVRGSDRSSVLETPLRRVVALEIWSKVSRGTIRLETTRRVSKFRVKIQVWNAGVLSLRFFGGGAALARPLFQQRALCGGESRRLRERRVQGVERGEGGAVGQAPPSLRRREARRASPSNAPHRVRRSTANRCVFWFFRAAPLSTKRENLKGSQLSRSSSKRNSNAHWLFSRVFTWWGTRPCRRRGRRRRFCSRRIWWCLRKGRPGWPLWPGRGRP